MAKTGGGRNHLPLPPALLAEILSRLPAKDLLRFKCVHKQWANLINSRDFIKLHVKRTASSRKNRTLVISNDSLYSVNLKTNQTIELEGFPLKSSIIPDSSYPDLFATCDGLLCYMLRVPHSDLKSDIIIWNMTTKEYRKVRVVCRSAVLGYYEVYGFGYDSMRDDYKLVRIIQFPNVIKKVEVYSLRHKSWSTVTAACPHFLLAAGRDASVAHVNGSLYWIMSTERSVTAATARTLVIAFNLSTEDYTEVETPHIPYLGKERIFKLFVVGLEGKLCLVYNSKYRVDIWLMAEYGKKRSWYKFLSLDEPLDARNYQLVPLAISAESNSRILLHWSGLVGLRGRYCWYDIKKHKARIRVVDELQSEERCQWEICLSSLVKLDAKGYSKVPKSGNWKEEKNKRRVERDGNEENSSQSNGGLQIPRVRIFRGHPSRKKEAAWCLELGSLVRLPNSLEELKNIAGEKLGFDTTDLMVIDDAGGIIDSIEVIRDNDTLFMVNEELRRRSFSHYFILLISILFLFVAAAWCNASLWKHWSGNE